MVRDQDMVKQLQRRLQKWDPDGQCSIHSGQQNCEYNELGQLIILHLCRLELTQVPSDVWQCSALQWLSLDDNQLSTLPAEVGQLTALQKLDLGNNQFSTLPAEVGKLTALHRLDLHNNQLSTLPAEVGKLTALQGLDLHNNPLQIPLPEIIAQGTPAILAYLRTRLPIKVFYCYAHEDKELRDQIEKHLGVLTRSRHIVRWYDRDIQAGMEWQQEIERHLRTADLIVLLISADFVHSDYCFGVEMTKALELHHTGQACVLPILLRPIDWQDAPFAHLQMLPTGALPITKWKDQDEALEDGVRV